VFLIAVIINTNMAILPASEMEIKLSPFSVGSLNAGNNAVGRSNTNAVSEYCSELYKILYRYTTKIHINLTWFIILVEHKIPAT
jgi:hypothetical protein